MPGVAQVMAGLGGQQLGVVGDEHEADLVGWTLQHRILVGLDFGNKIAIELVKLIIGLGQLGQGSGRPVDEAHALNY